MIAILTALSMPLNAGDSNIGRTAVNLTKNLTSVIDDTETFRSPCGEIALSGGIGEKGQARQAYRIATIKTKNTITQELSMDEMGANFIIDKLPEHFSPDCDLAWLGLLDSGEIFDDSGTVIGKHERYYCAFILVANSCVLAVHTDMTCAGSFDKSGKWQLSEGSRQIDFLNTDFPTAQRYADHPERRDDKVLNIDNVLRCDPISQKNLDHYLRINSDSSVEMSDSKRTAIMQRIQTIQVGQ